jgi:hypothetical protein
METGMAMVGMGIMLVLAISLILISRNLKM